MSRTIAHELIHAYLYCGQTDSNLYGAAFGTVKSYLSGPIGGINASNNQHRLMANEYINTISSVLNTYTLVEGIGLPTGGIPMLSNEQYLEFMSWAGLSQTPQWNLLSQPERDKIESILYKESHRQPGATTKSGC